MPEIEVRSGHPDLGPTPRKPLRTTPRIGVTPVKVQETDHNASQKRTPFSMSLRSHSQIQSPVPSTSIMSNKTTPRSTRRGHRSLTPKTDVPKKSLTESSTGLTGVTKRQTRARRSKVPPKQEASESPIKLISPIKEQETETSTNQGSRKVVRVPRHSMSLRTSSRNKRTVKLY